MKIVKCHLNVLGNFTFSMIMRNFHFYVYLIVFVLYNTACKPEVHMCASCKILCLLFDVFPPLLQTSVGSHTRVVMS